MMYTKYSYKLILKEFIYMILGCFFISFGTVIFLLPHKISSGGFTGIATIFYYIFNFKMGAVILVLNIPLFIIGFFRIGKYFFCKTIFSTFLLSYMIDFLENINLNFLSNVNDVLLLSIYGGIIIGIGTSFIFLANTSTGGTELLIQIILSFKKQFKVSTLIMIIDSIVVLLNLVVFNQIEIGLYSLIVICLNSKIVDIIVEGLDFTKVVYIISNKNDIISDAILKDLNKGVTGIYGKGLYSKNDMMILMCVIRKRDILDLKNLVVQIDEDAFVIITDSTNVYGLGFEKN